MTTALTFDHAFCFCERSAENEVKAAMAAGFQLTAEKRHQNQGTSNRCILFDENYFELIYLNSKTEATENPLRLRRRADWKKTGASPFGIGLRGQLAKRDLAQFWEYKPAYFPNGRILIHRSNEQQPHLPLIFVIESAVKPAEQNLDRSLLRHRSVSTAIKKIEIRGPAVAWPALPAIAGVEFSESDSFSMNISLDGDIPQPILINKLASMRSALGSPFQI